VPTEIEHLYREHRAALVRLVERELHDHHDAEDVVQTAFLDAQRALERGTIPRNPRAWLAAIALNAGRRLRRGRLNAEPLEEYAVQEASGVPEIRAALAGLPREQRAAVVYRDVLGLSYGETAEQMGTSVNAVTMLLHRGRRRLRQTLGVTAGGIGSLRWLKRAGMPQVTIVKGAGAVVGAAALATTGIVAARLITPIGTDVRAAALATRAEGQMKDAGVLGLDSARRQFKATWGSRVSAAPSSTQVAPPFLPSMVQLPTLALTTLPIRTSPATVAVSTPVATVTVTTPTDSTAVVTTPITKVTVAIP
jgi:RNA polymerase sigma-70 factor (ECF subfamily)